VRLGSPGALARLAVVVGVVGVLAAGVWVVMLRMPGSSWRGPLPPLTAAEAALRDELRRDIGVLAGEIGERNLVRPDALARAVAYIEGALTAAGYRVRRQTYETPPEAFYRMAGVERNFVNLEGERPGSGRAAEIVVVGAHYDTVLGAPGANDNGSGVAALLALARRFVGRAPARTVRFVAFANEEVYFQQPWMGSLVYARALRQRGDRVVTMLSLETMGYYSDEPGSQRYPPPLGLLYPSAGNFIGFVGNVGSRAQVRAAVAAFRRHARVPSEGAALPPILPGIAWSDHWAFWQAGYPGVMVTDTAPYRYPHYHTRLDTPDRIDYDRLARVVAGLDGMLAELAAAR
jgi:Zn-dependent M28 family amino/carboxypeptidase